MNVTDTNFAELKSYFADLRKLLQTQPLNSVVYKEGCTLAQIAFHIAQSANYYLRVYVLEQEFQRDRSAEFTGEWDTQDIEQSIDSVLNACQKIVKAHIALEATLSQTKEVYSRRFTVTTVGDVIQHTTAHTAEHYGQLTMALEL